MSLSPLLGQALAAPCLPGVGLAPGQPLMPGTTLHAQSIPNILLQSICTSPGMGSSPALAQSGKTLIPNQNLLGPRSAPTSAQGSGTSPQLLKGPAPRPGLPTPMHPTPSSIRESIRKRGIIQPGTESRTPSLMRCGQSMPRAQALPPQPHQPLALQTGPRHSSSSIFISGLCRQGEGPGHGHRWALVFLSSEGEGAQLVATA